MDIAKTDSIITIGGLSILGLFILYLFILMIILIIGSVIIEVNYKDIQYIKNRIDPELYSIELDGADKSEEFYRHLKIIINDRLKATSDSTAEELGKEIDWNKIHVDCETCIHYELEKKLSCHSFCPQCKHYSKHIDFYKSRA